MFVHDHRTYVVARITNTTRCNGRSTRGSYGMDPHRGLWGSVLAMCEVGLCCDAAMRKQRRALPGCEGLCTVDALAGTIRMLHENKTR